MTGLCGRGELKMIEGEGLSSWGIESGQKWEYNSLELMDTVKLRF